MHGIIYTNQNMYLNIVVFYIFPYTCIFNRNPHEREIPIYMYEAYVY